MQVRACFLFCVDLRSSFVFLCPCVVFSCLYRFAVRRVVFLHGGTYIGVGTQQQLVNSSLLSKAPICKRICTFPNSSEKEGPTCG